MSTSTDINIAVVIATLLSFISVSNIATNEPMFALNLFACIVAASSVAYIEPKYRKTLATFLAYIASLAIPYVRSIILLAIQNLLLLYIVVHIVKQCMQVNPDRIKNLARNIDESIPFATTIIKIGIEALKLSLQMFVDGFKLPQQNQQSMDSQQEIPDLPDFLTDEDDFMRPKSQTNAQQQPSDSNSQSNEGLLEGMILNIVKTVLSSGLVSQVIPIIEQNMQSILQCQLPQLSHVSVSQNSSVGRVQLHSMLTVQGPQINHQHVKLEEIESKSHSE